MNSNMLKQNKWVLILIATSLSNWIIALYVLVKQLPLNKWIWLLMFASYIITPIVSVLGIIITLILIFKKNLNWILGSIIIISNVTYLVWGLKVFQIISYVT